jgi:hypothetical protein
MRLILTKSRVPGNGKRIREKDFKKCRFKTEILIKMIDYENVKIKMMEKTDTGFSAFSEKYSFYKSGNTITELMNNALAATSIHFEEENVKVSKENLKFEIDFRQFCDTIKY